MNPRTPRRSAPDTAGRARGRRRRRRRRRRGRRSGRGRARRGGRRRQSSARRRCPQAASARRRGRPQGADAGRAAATQARAPSSPAVRGEAVIAANRLRRSPREEQSEADRALHRPFRRGAWSTWPPAGPRRPAPWPRPGTPRRRATCWPCWRWARPGRPPARPPRRRAPTARSSISSRAAPTCGGSPASASNGWASAGLGLAIDTYRKAVQRAAGPPLGPPPPRLGPAARRPLRRGLRGARRRHRAEVSGRPFRRRRPRPAGRPGPPRGGLAARRAGPARRGAATASSAHDAELESEPSLRFVLNWETDANDVDLHIYDRQGGHAYYSQKIPALRRRALRRRHHRLRPRVLHHPQTGRTPRPTGCRRTTTAAARWATAWAAAGHRARRPRWHLGRAAALRGDGRPRHGGAGDDRRRKPREKNGW